MQWRLISDDNVSASFGLAADEYLARQVGLGASPPTLRLYTYRSHCALVGRHQNVNAEIDREFCAAHNLAINRRATGGGAIIMGEDQLGVALTLPLDAANGRAHRARELFARFSQGIVGGLDALGIRAEFGGKNDIVACRRASCMSSAERDDMRKVKRKKIAGLGIYHDKSGGLLLHASVLVDLDIALMLRVLKTPLEKISDKAIATVAQRVTTVRRETGKRVQLDQVRAAIATGYAQQFAVALTPGEFTATELSDIRQLERGKYCTREWIEQKTLAGNALGQARVKTPGGLVNVQLALAGDVIKAIYITGDFFADDVSVTALERALRWHAADAAAITKNVAEFFAGVPHSFDQIAPAEFTRAVLRAVDDARSRESSSEPYGCFVNP